MEKIECGMYARTRNGLISKIEEIRDWVIFIEDSDLPFRDKEIKASYNIIDLIEYMDLLVIENKLKDVDNREIYLFNPVRCDGFTTFEDGKHCMIINMDYIVPIENIKVYQVLTHELFESMSYKVGD